MKNTFRYSKAFQTAARMPRGMVHNPDRNALFDIMQSEAVAWLIQQPEIVNYLFTKARSTGAIEFDQATRTWGGIHAESHNE